MQYGYRIVPSFFTSHAYLFHWVYIAMCAIDSKNIHYVVLWYCSISYGYTVQIKLCRLLDDREVEYNT